jgi:hypothetical protein
MWYLSPVYSIPPFLRGCCVFSSWRQRSLDRQRTHSILLSIEGILCLANPPEFADATIEQDVAGLRDVLWFPGLLGLLGLRSIYVSLAVAPLKRR